MKRSLVNPGYSKPMSDLCFLSATEMARLVRSKELSAVELTHAHLDRIERLNPQLNAYVQVDAEGAMLQARTAEAAVLRGDELGPLHGVPVSIKNCIGVKGLRQEAGTLQRKGVVAAADAVLVHRMRAAGAVILGTTNTPELLMAWETDNLLYGRTNNPWSLDRTAGGSSGGEAAAIAAGLSAGGVGSDGGGSIRVPAHFCGICGLKPTPGRIPATGHFPPSGGPFAIIGVVGPMARTVADTRLLFSVMAGYDDGDTSSAPVPVRSVPPAELHKVRVAYFEDDGRTPVTPDTRAAVRRAAQALRDAGHEVVEFLPPQLERARQLWWKFFGTAGGMILGPMLAGHEAETSPFLKQYMEWATADPAHTGESLLEAWNQRDQIRTEFFAAMREFPILLCPAAAIPAFRHGERSWSIAGREVSYLDAWSYTEFFNLLGNPGMVIPVSQTATDSDSNSNSKIGLPIGVQIVAPPWQEELALAVAEAVESRIGGWQPPPLPECV